MDIGRILQNLDARLKRVERSPRLSHASVDNTSIEVRDGAGSLRGLLGVQADGTTAVNIVNGPPPPQPSAPIVASVLGGVTVSWDGQFTGGSPLPLDWARVEVHAAIVSSYEPAPATLQGTIETAQGATVVVPCDTDVYVRLVARNTSGTASVASDTVGPFGPTPVVADDITDGIVTTLKLANDAVTAAKIAASAVGTTEIADDAVTTGKVVAGGIQAGNIAAGAILTDKLAAAAVTTAKLDALAVTADKIAANTITAGKLAAGSVDATAIAATAITGKTITGGTITGALFQTAASGQRITINESGVNKVLVYDSSGTAIGELSAAGLLVKGINGALLWLDPNSTYPNMRLTNAAQTNSATLIVSGGAADANIGVNSGTFTGNGFSDMKWRTFTGNDFAVMERIRESANSTVIGGRVDLRATSGYFGYLDTTDATQNADMVFTPALGKIRARTIIQPYVGDASTSVLFLQPGPSHTGPIIRYWDPDAGVYRFVVDKSGNTDIGGILTAGNVAAGRLTITPVANVPTSQNVTGLNLKGTNIRVVACAATSQPGAQVTGVGVTNQSATGFTVWVTRTNTTGTVIDWIAYGV